MQLGYDPAVAPNRFQVSTASGVEFVPRLTVKKIAALGQEREAFSVLCHTRYQRALGSMGCSEWTSFESRI